MNSENLEKKTAKTAGIHYFFQTISFIFILVALDLVTKALGNDAAAKFNPGISFGLFLDLGNSFWLIAQIIIASSVLFFLLRRRYPLVPRLGLCALAAGGFGNAISRLIWNGVPDWICILDFPCFNFADIMINAGVILYLIWMLGDEKKRYGRRSNRAASRPRPGN